MLHSISSNHKTAKPISTSGNWHSSTVYQIAVLEFVPCNKWQIKTAMVCSAHGMVKFCWWLQEGANSNCPLKYPCLIREEKFWHFETNTLAIQIIFNQCVMWTSTYLYLVIAMPRCEPLVTPICSSPQWTRFHICGEWISNNRLELAR